MTEITRDSLRIDKWLWYARIFKTRGIAAQAVAKGVSITRAGRTERTSKPGFCVRPGDTIALVRSREVIILEILGLGERRGPAAEASMLYDRQTADQPVTTE